MSHSKRNTSRAVFTSYERSLAKSAWGASSARLSRDSFLPFGSCCLCLGIAIEPVACSNGDIFCRECALGNLLAQKQEIKRMEKAREQEERESTEMKARQEAEAHDRAVKDFELVQAGFNGTRGQSGSSVDRNDGPRLERQDSGESKRGEKRKFELDEEEVLRNAVEDRAKARRAIEDEKNSKPTLPSFWVPSVTPVSNKNDTLHEIKKKAKSAPVCPASKEDSLHHYSLHTLVDIQFTEETDSKTKQPRRICPSCKKELTNSSKAVLAKPCGHVLCKSCVNQFMKPTGKIDPHAPEGDPEGVRCYVCDADLTDRKKSAKSDKKEKERIKPGLVELKSDGTGFSAGGVNEVKKVGSGFQC